MAPEVRQILKIMLKDYMTQYALTSGANAKYNLNTGYRHTLVVEKSTGSSRRARMPKEKGVATWRRRQFEKCQSVSYKIKKKIK